MNKQNTYILQIEGKDIIQAGEAGYIVKPNKKYKATLDNPYELIKLEQVANSFNKKILFEKKEKQYTNILVSLTFKYAAKVNDININTEAIRSELYSNGFMIRINDKPVEYVRYKRSSGSSKVGKCLFIQKDFYPKMMEWSLMGLEFKEEDKVDLAALEAYMSLTLTSIIDTIDIKPENILLIDDYISTFKDKVMCTEIVQESYTDDYYTQKVRDRLHTEPKEVEINNSIWDGQSLLDSSLFGEKYKDKGMLLLRNRYFKTACFNTNIQQFFKDNNITDISQLNGKTFAKDIKDIKLIITPSSLKYLKFGTYDNYMNRVDSTFGIAKYEKPTKFFNGKLVQTHYQLLNTIQLKKEQVLQFVQPTLDYINLLKNDMRVFREHLKIRIEDNLEIGEISSSDELIFALLQISDRVVETPLFKNFQADVIESYIKNLKKGHVLIPGNYSVLFGNGLEMLKATIKDTEHPMAFRDIPVLIGDNIHCTNFKYNTKLLGCRSPHVTIGNLWLPTNIECKVLDKYFNLSPEIVCINSINNNVLERLSGSDFDSDQLLLTNTELLIDAVQKNYNRFLVPTSKVEAEKVLRNNTPKEKCDLDVKTSKNLIGDIINTSQILNSRLWDMVNSDSNETDIQELYTIICQLDVMSCIEIDKAKKEFTINNQLELNEIKKTWVDSQLIDQNKNAASKMVQEAFNEVQELFEDEQDTKWITQKYKEKGIDLSEYREVKVRPYFFKFVAKEKKNSSITKTIYDYVKHDTTMDYFEVIICQQLKKCRKVKDKGSIELSQLFNCNDVKISKADRKQITRIIKNVTDLKTETDRIWKSENMNSKEKYIQTNKLKNDYIKKISGKVKIATLKKIICTYSSTDEYDKIARKLMSILYKSNKESFMQLFEENKEKVISIKRLYRKPVKDDEIINLYGFKYIAV